MLALRNTSVVPPGRYRYYQAETRVEFGPYGTFRQLTNAVKLHRKSNNLPIGTEFDAEIADWLCRHMEAADEYCYDAAHRRPSVHRPARETPTGFNGREHWRRLHLYALVSRPTAEQREFWLSDFAKTLPCGDCRRGWRTIIGANPLPKEATPEDFFAKTVEWHNAVSEKIGSATMGVDAARDLWAR